MQYDAESTTTQTAKQSKAMRCRGKETQTAKQRKAMQCRSKATQTTKQCKSMQCRSKAAINTPLLHHYSNTLITSSVVTP
jgi:hypothetical protein